MISEQITVACYCRVSTENQIENYSIDEQKERLEAFCKAKGWSIGETFVDAGYSGGNTDRPALKKLLERAKAKAFGAVVVYKLDRLSRSQKDTLYLIEDVFGKYGISFVSVCENFDTGTAFGKAMIGILSVFAQLEKEQITERFTMGRIGRAKSGLYHGGSTAPTGYDYIDGRLIINEFKAIQVQEVFLRFLHGESIHSIQKSMQERYGGWSSHTLVRNALKNTVYIGRVRFGGKEYDGEHQPIISEETFFEAQRLMSKRRTDNAAEKTPFRAGYLLSGLVICGKCGARYHADHGSYKCYSRSKTDKRRIIDADCKNPNIRIEELDSFVCEEIKRASIDLSNIRPDTEFGEFRLPDHFFTEAAKKRLSEIRSQSERLLDLYQNADISTEIVSERLRFLEHERTALENSISKLQKRPNELSESDIMRIYKKFPEGCDTTLGRAFISALIESVVIAPNGDITIYWRM